MIEFDIEVNPTKLVKGLGLAKLMEEENYETEATETVEEQHDSQ